MTRRTNPPTAQPMMRGRLLLLSSGAAAVVAGASDVAEAAPKDIGLRASAALASAVALPLVEMNWMMTVPFALTVPLTESTGMPSNCASFAAKEAPVTLPVALEPGIIWNMICWIPSTAVVVGAAVVIIDAAVVEAPLLAFPPVVVELAPLFTFPPAVVEGATVFEVVIVVVLGAAVVIAPVEVVGGAMVVVVAGTGRPQKEKLALGMQGAAHPIPLISAYSHMVLHMLVAPSQKQPFMSWKKGPMQSAIEVASEHVGVQSCAAVLERKVQPELAEAHLVWFLLFSEQRT